MKLPAKTSRLLDLHSRAHAALHARFAAIFARHRGLAFVRRQDHVFTEHWTPERAAAGYEFSGHEVRGEQVVLHGVATNQGFNYQISIAFPLHLVDTPAELDEHLQREYQQAAGAAVCPSPDGKNHAG